MKMIQPVTITDDILVSDAPDDDYPAWEPTGYDLSESFGIIKTATVDNNSYVVKYLGSTNNLRLYDLTDGSYTSPLSISSIKFCTSIAVSPDGLYLAVMGVTDVISNALEIYDVATWTLQYESTGAFYSGFMDNYFEFSPDSSKFAFISRTNYSSNGTTFIKIVAVGSWTTTSSTAAVSTMVTGYVSGGLDAVMSLTFSDDSLILYFSSSVQTASYLHTHFIGRVLVSDGTVITRELQDHSFAAAGYSCMFNTSISELLVAGYGGVMYGMDETDLTDTATVPTIPASVNVQTMRPSPDSDEFIISINASPYFLRKKLSDYTDLTAMPTHIPYSQYGRVRYSDDYYTWHNSTDGGLGITQRSDDAQVTQTNPSVIANDFYIYENLIYKVLTDNTDRPDTGAAKLVPTWLEFSAINRLKMFDGKLGTLTSGIGSLTATTTHSGLINGVALFNVSAEFIQITVTDDTDGLVYDTGQVEMLDNSTINDWYAYFFEPYSRKIDIAFVDLPPYAGADITITLTSTTGEPVSIGQAVMGSIRNLGDAQMGAEVGILNRSTKTDDGFGNFTITSRAYSKQGNFPIVMDSSSSSGIYRILANYRDIPAVWIGDENREETIIYGFYIDFDIVIPGLGYNEGFIQIEGL